MIVNYFVKKLKVTWCYDFGLALMVAEILSCRFFNGTKDYNGQQDTSFGELVKQYGY